MLYYELSLASEAGFEVSQSHCYLRLRIGIDSTSCWKRSGSLLCSGTPFLLRLQSGVPCECGAVNFVVFDLCAFSVAVFDFCVVGIMPGAITMMLFYN